jgi:hypothetical protein
MPNHRKTSYEDFWNKVQKTDSCWLWTGSIRGGYGSYSIARQTRVRAHVFMLTHFMNVGIPEGYIVCHTCDVRHCVNPEHLYVGTKSSNAKDWWDRQATPEQRNVIASRMKWPEKGTPEYEQRCRKHSEAALERWNKF